MYGGFALFDHSLLTECPTSEKSDSLGPKLGAPYYGIIWGWGQRKQAWWKAKWNVSAGLKQLKIAKRKGELKERNMKLRS